MRFIGRRKELALFSKELGSGRAASILLYGRRRVGKTTLFRTVLNEASGIRILYIRAFLLNLLKMQEIHQP